MASKEKIIYVYDGFSREEPTPLGRLYVGSLRGSESYSFSYDEAWLAENANFQSLDPALMPFPGRQFPVGKGMFGAFADASPDRWGRVLMNKRERLLAEKEERKARSGKRRAKGQKTLRQRLPPRCL